MPETIRTANGRLRSRPRRADFLAALRRRILSGADAEPPASARVNSAVAALGGQDSRQPGADPRARLLRRARRPGAAAHAPHRRPRAKRARAKRPASCRPRSTGSRRCCCREPQVLVAWPAASDRPEILGDTALFVPGAVAGTRARLRRLAGRRRPRSAWSKRSNGCGGEGRGFVHDAHHAPPAGRSRRKAARSADARCCGCATSAASSAS